MERNRQPSDAPQKGGASDSVAVTTQRQVDLDRSTLLEIVNKHLPGFHHQRQAGALDRFGARIHTGAFGEIVTRLNLDMAKEIQPVVEFVWNIHPAFADRGYKLLGFKSMKGFGATHYQPNHSTFGHLFCSTDVAIGRGTPSHREFVQEGTYYFTFFLFKPGMLAWFDRYEGPVQFTEAVPSRDWALAQLKTQRQINVLGRKEQVESEQHKGTLWKAQQETKKLTGQSSGSTANRVEAFKNEFRKISSEDAEIAAYVQDMISKEMEFLYKSDKYLNAGEHKKRAMKQDLELRLRQRIDELKQ